MPFWSAIILDFFVAFGVVVGGSLMGGIGSLLGLSSGLTPMGTIEHIVGQLKVWAIVAALGGTVDVLRTVEVNIRHGDLDVVAQQLFLLLSAFAGAHLGYKLVMWLIRGDVS
ncbi:YtrH family sporulation protein [Numidum massiliense]|uniref:YtrH family sporulation protein n=1 Tax=Numidum massiliense TaxID=1522315 RepID=UPI0006D565CC|nr:YtrH family sporulation protein [Numidum massiliense]